MAYPWLITAVLFWISPGTVSSLRSDLLRLPGIVPDTVTDLTWNPASIEGYGYFAASDRSALVWGKHLLVGISYQYSRTPSQGYKSQNVYSKLLFGFNLPTKMRIGGLIWAADSETIDQDFLITDIKHLKTYGLRIGARLLQGEVAGVVVLTKKDRLYDISDTPSWHQSQIDTTENLTSGIEWRHSADRKNLWIQLLVTKSQIQFNTLRDEYSTPGTSDELIGEISGAWIQTTDVSQVSLYMGVVMSLSFHRIVRSAQRMTTPLPTLSQDIKVYPWSLSLEFPISVEKRFEHGAFYASTVILFTREERVNSRLTELPNMLVHRETRWQYGVSRVPQVGFMYQVLPNLKLTVSGALSPEILDHLRFSLQYRP